jgi:hypothetical protein
MSSTVDFNPRVKRLYLGLLTTLSIVVVIGAFLFDPKPISVSATEYIQKRFSNLTPKQWIAILSPIVAFIVAKSIHWADKKHNGGGIRHRVIDIGVDRFEINAGVLSATMTKQSVLAAIAAILLAIVQAVRNALSQANAIEPSALNDSSTLPFSMFAAELSTIGFLVSILLLLVSMKCYDYANRFKLADVYKITLVDKGLKFDIASWYALLYSFILGIASISVTISIFLSILAAYLLWGYYFIHPIETVKDAFPVKQTAGTTEPETMASQHG